MKRLFPILLIWFTVATSLFELLAQLQLMLIGLREFLEIFVVVSFVLSIIVARKQFMRDSQWLLQEVKDWEPDMLQDIMQFVKVRKTRLLTSTGTITVFLILKVGVSVFYPQFKEAFLYIFVIGLFHVALITSLILFKMSRTIAWARYENILIAQEPA